MKKMPVPKGRVAEKPGGAPRLSQTREEIEEETGWSPDQQKRAMKVASVPAEKFKEMLEDAPKPATVTGFCDASYVVVRANWWTAKLEEPVRNARKKGGKREQGNRGVTLLAAQKVAESKRAKLLGLELEEPVRRKKGRPGKGNTALPLSPQAKMAASRRAKLLGLELEELDAYIDERKRADPREPASVAGAMRLDLQGSAVGVTVIRMVDRQRARNLNVRVTDDEAEMLRALAERKGLSGSDIVRQYIREAYAAEFPPKKTKR